MSNRYDNWSWLKYTVFPVILALGAASGAQWATTEKAVPDPYPNTSISEARALNERLRQIEISLAEVRKDIAYNGEKIRNILDELKKEK